MPKNRKILVVLIDNNEFDIDLYKRFLTNQDIEFFGFVRLPPLIKWLESNTANIILIDLAMPEKSGIEVAKILFEMRTGAHLAYLTGETIDAAVIESASLYGIERVFIKDGDFIGFAQTLKKWISE